MLIQGFSLLRSEIHIHSFLEKSNKQIEVYPIEFEANVHVSCPLWASCIPWYLSELKIYSTSVWAICAHDPLHKLLTVKVRSIMRK